MGRSGTKSSKVQKLLWVGIVSSSNQQCLGARVFCWTCNFSSYKELSYLGWVALVIIFFFFFHWRCSLSIFFHILTITLCYLFITLLLLHALLICDLMVSLIKSLKLDWYNWELIHKCCILTLVINSSLRLLYNWIS